MKKVKFLLFMLVASVCSQNIVAAELNSPSDNGLKINLLTGALAIAYIGATAGGAFYATTAGFRYLFNKYEDYKYAQNLLACGSSSTSSIEDNPQEHSNCRKKARMAADVMSCNLTIITAPSLLLSMLLALIVLFEIISKAHEKLVAA